MGNILHVAYIRFISKNIFLFEDIIVFSCTKKVHLRFMELSVDQEFWNYIMHKKDGKNFGVTSV